MLLPGAVVVVVPTIALLTIALGGTSAVEGGIPVEQRTAAACLLVLGAVLCLGRLTHSVLVAPVMALLAAQPVLPLVLPLLRPTGWDPGVTSFAGMLITVLLDAVASSRLHAVPAQLAETLMRLGAALVAGYGLLFTIAGTATDSWTVTGLLATAGAVALVVRRDPRLAPRLPLVPVTTVVVGVVGVALLVSLRHSV